MSGSFRVARISGIDINVHVSFLLIVLLGAWQWGSTGPAGAVFGAVLTLMLFACVALHELGHSLVAQAFGIPVRNITLLPIGGIALLGRKPDRPAHELLIALAGPAVNVVIAALLFAFAVSAYGPEALLRALQHIGRTAPTVETLWAVLMTSNLALAAFNLLPAFPMDGGRVFRALLSFPLEPERATRVAALVGRVIAVGLFVLGFAAKSPMLPFIALFIFFGAGEEVREARLSGALGGIRAGDAVNPYVPRFSPDTPIAEAVRALVFTPHPAFAVEHFGRLVGVVTREALVTAAREASPTGWISSVMSRQVPLAQASESLEVVRQRMQEARVPYAGILDRDLFLGLVTELELAQQTALALALRQRLEPVRPRSLPR